MKEITRERKNAKRLFSDIEGGDWMKGQMVNIVTEGKKAFDACAMKMGRMLAETILYMEREEMTGHSSGCHHCWTNCEDWGLEYGEYHCH